MINVYDLPLEKGWRKELKRLKKSLKKYHMGPHLDLAKNKKPKIYKYSMMGASNI